jgi:hypothetical protein
MMMREKRGLWSTASTGKMVEGGTKDAMQKIQNTERV